MKKITVLVCGVLLLLMAGGAQAATVMTEFGRSPFYQPPLKSVSDFQQMVATNEAEIKKGFALAGREDLAEPFLAQVKAGNAEIREFQKGTTMPWMFYKKHGKGTVKISRDVVWNNDEPFKAIVVEVEQGETIATIVTPLACGNVALLGERAKPVAVARQNQSPVCSMTITPAEAFAGETVTVDASGSADPDGDVVRMSVAVIDAQGAVVSTQESDPGTLTTQVVMPAGEHTVKVTVVDNEGAVSSPSECVGAIKGTDRFGIVADLGFYRQFDPGTYLFGRIGGEYRINEDFSVLGLIGVAPQIHGNDGATAVLLDVLGEYRFGDRFFANLGVGGWLTDGDSDMETEDSQLDVIVGLGARVFGEPDQFNTSIFVEMRSGIDELDSLQEYGRFGAGLRFRF